MQKNAHDTEHNYATLGYLISWAWWFVCKRLEVSFTVELSARTEQIVRIHFRAEHPLPIAFLILLNCESPVALASVPMPETAIQTVIQSLGQLRIVANLNLERLLYVGTQWAVELSESRKTFKLQSALRLGGYSYLQIYILYSIETG